uniref:Uncharacterized protein n=1 Tax=Cannabis sativa TaxID=3483 RepID=A0A803QBA8_CANSA
MNAVNGNLPSLLEACEEAQLEPQSSQFYILRKSWADEAIVVELQSKSKDMWAKLIEKVPPSAKNGFSCVAHFDNKPVIMRPWSPDLDVAKLNKSVPVSVKIHGLGLPYWGMNYLISLVSTISTLIVVDQITKDCSQAQFAPVLVDI